MTESDNAGSKKPTYIAYFVKQGAERAFWTECGVAWPHKDGLGLRLKLDAVPVGGIVELRINHPSTREESNPSDSRAPETQ